MRNFTTPPWGYNGLVVDFLSPEQEFDLAGKALGWDIYSRDKIVQAYIPWVRRIVSEFKPKWSVIDQDDLVQGALIDILKQFKKFDPNLWRFSTFITPIVKWAIFRMLSSFWTIVKLPTTKVRTSSWMVRLESLVRMWNLTNMSQERLSVAGFLKSLWAKIWEDKFLRAVSTYEWALSIDVDTGDGLTLWEMLSSDGSGPEQVIEGRRIEALILSLPQIIQDTLGNWREAHIVLSRYWIWDQPNLTLHVLWKIYWVSVERIRQIQWQSVKRIWKALS